MKFCSYEGEEARMRQFSLKYLFINVFYTFSCGTVQQKNSVETSRALRTWAKFIR